MTRIAIGKIINTHGLKGEVKIESWSNYDDQRYVKGQQLYLSDGKEVLPVKVATYRRHKGFPLVSFAGLQDINQIEAYKGFEVQIEDSDRPPLPEGQFYLADLIGLEVQDEEGNVVGEVIDVEPTNGAQDNLRVEREDGTTVLIPYVPAFIVEVDIEAEVIVIHVIEGLL